MQITIQLAVGLIFSSLIGWAAHRRGALTPGGALGAVIVGTAIFGFGGLTWGLLLITFFVSSTLLSHYKETVKEGLAEKFAKGSRRDLGQALANGGAGALIALGVLAVPDATPLLAAYLGVMATVNADTWATELGVLDKKPPRLITTWQIVEPGTSGGVSLTGLFAKTGGSLLIGLAALAFLALERLIVPAAPSPAPALVLAALAGGLAGSYFDSLLGASIQAIYYCPACDKETERHPQHLCGAQTVYKRGWHWLNNDLVNFVSSLVGALAALGVWLLAR